MNKRFQEYETVIFDCDGVVLDSNTIKSNAFYNAVSEYGEIPALELLKFHQENGGVSRYKKFKHFFTSIFPVDDFGEDMHRVLQLYSQHVWKGLLSCNFEQSVEDLKQANQSANWLIVSGGDQIELRKIFLERGISEYFNGGIFGSPDTKEEILAREKRKGNIRFPALFIGDSKYDYVAAKAAGLDFIFISQWTEVAEWKSWVANEKIKNVKDLKGILC